MKMSSSKTPSRAMSVAELLRRMAQELRQLTPVVDNLQSLVGRLVSANVLQDTGMAHQLQHFDSLGQTLSAIADFAEALGGDAPPEWLLDPHSASRAVLLSDLAARLVSHLESPSLPDPAVAGEFEFF
jgi:hypothetical protein